MRVYKENGGEDEPAADKEDDRFLKANLFENYIGRTAARKKKEEWELEREREDKNKLDS